MPPYATMPTVATSELEAEEELVVSLKHRERDLLAIIATKDKRIQQLEEKLEAQAAFIDAVLKLSDEFKSTNTRKLRRRVSWCPSVDAEQTKRTTSDSSGDRFEISVDDIELDSDDELSVLSEEQESDKKLPANAASQPKDKAAKQVKGKSSKPQPKDAPKAQAKDEGEVDVDEEAEVRLSIVEVTGEDADRKVAVQKAVESSVVQAIIEGLRDDSDSISI